LLISEMPLNITSNLGGTGSVANVASAPLIPTDNFVGAVKPIPGIASSAIPTPTAPITPGSALTGAERYFGDKATSDLAAERYAAENRFYAWNVCYANFGGHKPTKCC
jgi:hypothetical protein